MPENPAMNKFDKVMVGFFSIVIAVGSLVITLIIMGAAAARYILHVNFVGYDEIVVLVAFWFYFMGAAYGAYNNSHVTADIIDAYVPLGVTRNVLAAIRWAAACFACGLFVYYGFNYLKFSFMGPLGNFRFLPKSMTWRIPLWISQSAIFIGLSLMELYFLRNFLLSIKALAGGNKA
ncbi:C4-dicarboxylate ABC transporter permease [Synergistales bacterium]|nr:C4-dicarboxylate ABC transporter permease [Synergistales bacterium]